MSWTDERVDLLARLWGEGLSASQIAGQLGGGVTRNAVIGKVHRLKLEGRGKPATTVEAPVDAVATVEIEVEEEVVTVSRVAAVASVGSIRAVARGAMAGATAFKMEPEEEIEAAPQPVALRGSAEVLPISRNLTLVQLNERTCKWPLGDPLAADFRFCGNHAGDASPYCAYHSRLAFQPVSERRRVR